MARAWARAIAIVLALIIDATLGTHNNNHSEADISKWNRFAAEENRERAAGAAEAAAAAPLAWFSAL